MAAFELVQILLIEAFCRLPAIAKGAWFLSALPPHKKHLLSVLVEVISQNLLYDKARTWGNGHWLRRTGNRRYYCFRWCMRLW